MDKLDEPATEKQLEWLKRIGEDVVNTQWTKRMAATKIGSIPIEPAQLKHINSFGFNFKSLTIFQFRSIIDQREEFINKIKKTYGTEQ